MEYDTKLGMKLVDELIELWIITNVQCEKIEEIIVQFKKK